MNPSDVAMTPRTSTPARFLLWTSLASLGLSGLFSLFLSVVYLAYADPGKRGLAALVRGTWGQALETTLREQQPHFLYLGVLGFMLWSVWRDEQAAWTTALSNTLKIAFAFIIGGLLFEYLWMGFMPPLSGNETVFRFAMGQHFAVLVETFGMTLWLHALAANQIPKLMTLVMTRRKANLQWGQVLLAIGCVLSLMPFMGAGSDDPKPSQIGWWLSYSFGFPLLLLSFSLFSMTILAGPAPVEEDLGELA